MLPLYRRLGPLPLACTSRVTMHLYKIYPPRGNEHDFIVSISQCIPQDIPIILLSDPPNQTPIINCAEQQQELPTMTIPLMPMVK